MGEMLEIEVNPVNFSVVNREPFSAQKSPGKFDTTEEIVGVSNGASKLHLCSTLSWGRHQGRSQIERKGVQMYRKTRINFLQLQ